MKHLIEDIGTLPAAALEAECEQAPRITAQTHTGQSRKLYIESYGCQMNYSDSEIVTSILAKNGFDTTDTTDDADLILLNTCAIRDNAEQKIRHRLQRLNFIKKQRPDVLIGVLGCMAERLKTKLLEQEQIVDMVVGPDAYRDLPRLIDQASAGLRSVNVFLSREETYSEIVPVRLNTNGVSAFISIMRGCDNMCSFCVVPFTRGRERSREPESIAAEARDLFDKGYKEVTLLGQNVDSYKFNENGQSVNFAGLLEKIALISPLLRIRFSTSHPKDITDEVLHTMAKYENICNYIHLPAQSGNNRILDLMSRGYTREWYLGRIEAIKRILGPDCGISTDIISGFCSETQQEHEQTLSLMEEVKYDYAYMFAYSERPNTPAAKKYADDIDEETKKSRLTEIIALQRKLSLARNQEKIGKVYKVLVEGFSRKTDAQLSGRISENAVVVFDKLHFGKGDYVDVLITDCSGGTLMGRAV